MGASSSSTSAWSPSSRTPCDARGGAEGPPGDSGGRRAASLGWSGRSTTWRRSRRRACPLNGACDWYSVGVMLYEALTGLPPVLGQAAPRVLQEKQEIDPTPPFRARPERPARDLDAALHGAARPPARRRGPTGIEVLDRLGSADGRRPRTRPRRRRRRVAPRIRRARAAPGRARGGLRRGGGGAGRRRCSSTAAPAWARAPSCSASSSALPARRRGRPGGPLLRAGVGPVQGDRQPGRRPGAPPRLAAPGGGRAPCCRRTSRRWRGSSRSSSRSRASAECPATRRRGRRPAGAAPQGLRRPPRAAGEDRPPSGP